MRRGLASELERSGSLESPSVRRAFLAVPRERFVAEVAARDGLERVYRDEVIVTAFDDRGFPISSSSQPGIMAPMLERLELREGHRVLEVGAGTGYNAALLAEIVGPRGTVASVELDEALARRARAALRENGSRVRVVRGDGREGWERGAPYDRIVVTAATGELPLAWLTQLNEGGLLELPLWVDRLGQVQAVVTFKRRGDRLVSVAVLWGGFMPLRGEGDSAETPRAPSLGASEMVGAHRAPLAYLSGEALAGLSRADRRRLLALALGEPRTLQLGLRAQLFPLVVWLALEAPLGQFVRGQPFPGLVAAGGRSLALLGGRRTVTRIEAYGEPEAEFALLDLIERWKARGRPGAGELRVEASFPRGRSGIGWSWRD